MSHTLSTTCILEMAMTAALGAITTNDGGSCNLDTVVVTHPPKDIAVAAKRLGLMYFSEEREGIIMPPKSNYQGFNRTAQCEAIAKVLNDNGIDAYVKYVMD